MIIQPKVRGFICTNAHPDGCASAVAEQIAYTQQQTWDADGPKNVLIIGCSTGYGLASRIVAGVGYGAKTLGVCYEKEPTERKTASPGWYNTAAFHRHAQSNGLYAHTINGDAFTDDVKQRVIDEIKRAMGKVDLVIYSLASPRRTDPDTGEVYRSSLKPVGQAYTSKNYDTDKDLVHQITLEPATEEEIHHTVKVMGGEDWQRWIQQLAAADVLSKGCKTTAYTYIGKALTWPIYGQATIGKAKEDLDRAAAEINTQFAPLELSAHVSSLKALVTQASSAIPVMPLYISLMYRVMKDEGTHEGCIEQVCGLFKQCLYATSVTLDEHGRFRMDTKETNDATQAKIQALWDVVTQENFHQLSDYKGYQQEFLKLFGFGFANVDYSQDVDPIVNW